MDKIRLIASDLDATLLDEHSALPSHFDEMVRALADEGIIFVAASGRPLITLKKMFEPLLDYMALIADNGGTAEYKGETFFLANMPQADWKAIAHTTAEAGDIGVLCGQDRAYIEKRHAWCREMLAKFYPVVEYVDSLETLDAEADKYSIYLPKGNAQQAFDEIYGSAYGDKVAVVVAGPEWVDTMNLDVNKGAALVAVGRKLDIPPEAMMAFGDTYNDADMLTAVRYGFLMANGSEPLRQRVPFLAPANTEHGVVQVIEKVLAKHGCVSAEDFIKAH